MKTKGLYFCDEIVPIPVRNPLSLCESTFLCYRYVVGRYVGDCFHVVNKFDNMKDVEKFFNDNIESSYELLELSVSLKKLT